MTKLKSQIKRAPTARKKPAKGAGAIPDSQPHIWGTLPECLAWLKDAGFKLSERKARQNYGAGAPVPIRRDKKGRWHYPEFEERVRVNREGFQNKYQQQSEAATARQQAKARLDTIRAQQMELQFQKRCGELVELEQVRKVWVGAIENVKAEFRQLETTLPADLAGATEDVIRIKLAAAHVEMLRHLQVHYSEQATCDPEKQSQPGKG